MSSYSGADTGGGVKGSTTPLFLKKGGQEYLLTPPFCEDKLKSLLQSIFHGRYFTFPACFTKLYILALCARPHRSTHLNFQFRWFALMGAFHCPKYLFMVISIHYSHYMNCCYCYTPDLNSLFTPLNCCYCYTPDLNSLFTPYELLLLLLYPRSQFIIHTI